MCCCHHGKLWLEQGSACQIATRRRLRPTCKGMSLSPSESWLCCCGEPWGTTCMLGMGAWRQGCSPAMHDQDIRSQHSQGAQSTAFCGTATCPPLRAHLGFPSRCQKKSPLPLAVGETAQGRSPRVPARACPAALAILTQQDPFPTSNHAGCMGAYCNSSSPCGCQEMTPLPPAAGSGCPGWGTCCHCWHPAQAAAQHSVQGWYAPPRALPQEGTPTAGLPGGAGLRQRQLAGAAGAGQACLKGGQAASCPVLKTLKAPERPAPARAGELWCAAAAAEASPPCVR